MKFTITTTILLLILINTISPALSQIPPEYRTNFDPSTTLHITYGNHTIQDGEELPPSFCKHQPTPSVSIPLSSNTLITHGIIIICIDPDSQPNTEVTHWIQSGWRRNRNHTGRLECNHTAEQSYSPPVPPNSTEVEWHRYVFLAFAQSERGKKLVDIPTSSDGKWSLQEWRKSNRLGMPFAGTYFKTGNPDSWTNTSEGKNYEPTTEPSVKIIYSDTPKSATVEGVVPLIGCLALAVAVVLTAGCL
ncbi:phosphatidylethanolamine-binding protein [Trichophaea hybrida]|nr:phosphatidylethanolamine-binding protein [Trichophaea hybrida]